MELFAVHFQDIAQAIQLSVAPVFLLAGVGATLNVLVGRLVRIVDRARVSEAQMEGAGDIEKEVLGERLKVLALRARLISRAIAFSVLCALLVPLVIVSLFVSAIVKVSLALPIAIAFVIALLSLSAGLVYFLREVFVATAALTFSTPNDQQGITQQLKRVVRNS